MSFINTFAQMLMAPQDMQNVANIPSDLKYHEDNRYKTAVVSRILSLSALGCRRVNESDPVEMKVAVCCRRST